MTAVENGPGDRQQRARGAQPSNSNALKHGYSSLARRLKGAGLKRNDGRSALERIKRDWKAEIRSARGGDLPPQQEVILETAANTWLLLSSVDDWLLDQPSLVNRRRRELLPVVQQRAGLVRDLRGLLCDLGIGWDREKPGPTLEDIVARYRKRAQLTQDTSAPRGEVGGPTDA